LAAGNMAYALAPAPEHSLGAGGDEAGKNANRSIRESVALTNAGVLEQVATHIRTAPLQSTRLLEAWIGEKGEKL